MTHYEETEVGRDLVPDNPIMVKIVREATGEDKIIYNQALDDAIEFFMNHIHCNNGKPIVRDYVCEQLEKMKK